jgi:hypothetical protein
MLLNLKPRVQCGVSRSGSLGGGGGRVQPWACASPAAVCTYTGYCVAVGPPFLPAPHDYVLGCLALSRVQLCQDLLQSPSSLFRLLDDVSLHWFLCCEPAGAPGTGPPAAPVSTDRTRWLDLFKVFPLGAFVASKLEVALWDAFGEAAKPGPGRVLKLRDPGGVGAGAATLTLTAKCMPPTGSVGAVGSVLGRERTSGDGGGSSAADGEMALRSKAHLAEFWNRLLPPERRKILGIEDDLVDPRQCRSFRGAGFPIDGSVAGSSITDGDHADDGETFESDNESDRRDASGIPSFACGGSSVDLPHSVDSADPSLFKHPSSSLSVRSDHYHPKSGNRYKFPTRRHSGAISRDHMPQHHLGAMGPTAARLHRSGSTKGEELGSSFQTAASSTAASTRSFADDSDDDGNNYSVDDGASDCPDVWPWCAVRWPGRELVASLFQSPLDRAGVCHGDEGKWVVGVGLGVGGGGGDAGHSQVPLALALSRRPRWQ